MKRILLLVAFIAIAFLQKASAQDSTAQRQLSQLLNNYLGIKDALVAGNSANASSQAEKYIETLNSIDYKIISEGNVNTLLKDATAISATSDVARQRTYFTNLSGNMAVLAKAVHLSSAPIYQTYCPMKKASWLSAERTIKNPYFGSAMLSCGSVVDTIQ